ncbi:hypothetical protein D3C72_962650 [compost metagenome]
MRLPAEHRGEIGDRFALEVGGGGAAVEGVVVGVDLHGHQVGDHGDRVRRLEHLAGVARVVEGVVVVEPVGEVGQDLRDARRRHVERRGRLEGPEGGLPGGYGPQPVGQKRQLGGQLVVQGGGLRRIHGRPPGG